MAKVAAKSTNIAVNSVQVEDDMDSFNLTIKQETPEVTGLDNAGPRRVTGNYDYGLDLSGPLDFASGQSDATFHGLVGSSGVAVAVDPTGASAGANDPNYDSTSMVLEEYSISGKVGGAVQGAVKLAGNSALARAVA